MAIKVPNIFSRDRQRKLQDNDMMQEANRLAKRRRAYKTLQRKQNKAGSATSQRIQGRQMGLVQRERDSAVQVRDQRRLDKQSEVRQDYLEIVGQVQANQVRQFNTLAQNLQQANRLVRGETQRQTELYSQILDEQRKFQDLADRRAQREQALAQFQQAQFNQGVGQQRSLARGRIAAARSNRATTPRRTLSLG